MHLTGRSGTVVALVTTLLFHTGIGFFVWGPIVDRIWPRKSGIIALVVWGISTAIAAVSPRRIYPHPIKSFARFVGGGVLASIQLAHGEVVSV